MPTLDDLARMLNSGDAEERREAALALGRIGPAALPLLLRAIGDSDWRIRKTAVESLVAIGGADVVTGLTRWLSAEDNAGARNSAIEALTLLGAAAVEPLLPFLRTAEADVRKFTIDILGDIRDDRPVPDLIAALRDPDENVAVAAAEALGKIGDRRAVDPLVACLARTDRGWLDYAAAEALGAVGDERALGPLLATLERSNMREPVIEALGRIGNADTLAPLLAGLCDPLRIVRESSVAALQEVYRKSDPAGRLRIAAAFRADAGCILRSLEELLAASGGKLQKAVVAMIGWCGRPETAQMLLDLLCEEEMEEAVAEALRRLGPAAAPALAERLRDDSALIRRTAAQVLGEIGGREAVQPLLALLEDENGHVRGTAAEALGRLKNAEAVPSLVRLLEDEYESVQEGAVRALAEIGDESAVNGLLNGYSGRPPSMRRNIVRLLGLAGTAAAAEALGFALKDEEPAVRKAVVAALSSLPADRTIRPLLLAVVDDDPEVRILAAESLARTGAAEAADALVPLLDDDDIWVRAAAARGLGALDAARYGPLLVERLARASDIFLLAIVEVLGKASVPEALGPLLSLAEHRDPEVRKTVLQALAAYDWTHVRPVALNRLFDLHWSVRKCAVELLQSRRDPATDRILKQVAEEDPDASVRDAAREAAGTK